MKNRLNPRFEQKILANFGNGRNWLDRLPEHLEELSNDWGLALGEPFEDLSYHYVAPASLADGTRAVLKTGPWNCEMSGQIIALEAYHGNGMCRLIRSDIERVAVLLERVEPGVTLWSRSTEENDAELTLIAANVMRKISRPEPITDQLLRLDNLMSGLRDHELEVKAAIPIKLVQMAITFAQELAGGPQALLHGDLHHGNILSNGDGWMAIDPKGMIGDPAFEPSAFLHNPFDSLFQFKNPKQALARRLDIFSEVLEIERERILKWAIAGCVLSVWWGVEDEVEIWAEGIQCAQWLSELL